MIPKFKRRVAKEPIASWPLCATGSSKSLNKATVVAFDRRQGCKTSSQPAPEQALENVWHHRLLTDIPSQWFDGRRPSSLMPKSI
jgi:hypothetical protein